MQTKAQVLLIVVSIIGCQASSSDTAPDPETPPTTETPVERALYREGKAIFIERCAVCHGKKADGNGTLSKTIEPPKPADFRKPVYAEMPVDTIRAVIVEGGAATGRNPRMPPWQRELSTEEIEAAIAFIRSVGHFGQIPTEQQVEDASWFAE